MYLLFNQLKICLYIFSSANAYMLMYRQIRSDNCVFMNEDELPDHVKKLVTKLHDDELKERELKDFKKSICRVSLMITTFNIWPV